MKKFLTYLLLAALILSTFVSCEDFNSQKNKSDKPATPIDLPTVSSGNVISDNNLRYVIIYNPQPYSKETFFTKTTDLSTGSLASQIDVNVNRADGLDSLPEFLPYDQEMLAPELLENFNFEGNKGTALKKNYKVGDTKEFFAYVSSPDSRTKATFTCIYSGTSCNIWAYGAYDAKIIKEHGEEFDKNIYAKCVSQFGAPRFDDKINFLYYSIDKNLIGCFCNSDLFATGEFTEEQGKTLGINFDHNILHINSKYAYQQNLDKVIKGTLAHEFQHLLCFTGYFTARNQCNTWFNEAMSGYIEEQLYPGTKKMIGHVSSYLNSNVVRYGQSLYNFETDSLTDLGPYGSVYYFAEYLAKSAGNDVFSNFHNYWRNYYQRGLGEQDALYAVIPSSLKTSVNNSIVYPTTLTFNSEAVEWMSKFVLQFYLASLRKETTSPSAFSNISPEYLLYDKLSATNIEGGGRIIVAVKGNSFQIPEDADSGLIYIGLDKNFNPVSNIIIK